MKIAATVLCLLALVLTTEAGPDSKMIVMPKNEPTWSFEAQTAVLFGVQNRNDYILAPQILSGWWRPADPRWGVFLAQGEGGLRAELTRSLSLQGGILYQHMSNAGLSEPEAPNVGLDAFAPFIGLRWEF